MSWLVPPKIVPCELCHSAIYTETGRYTWFAWPAKWGYAHLTCYTAGEHSTTFAVKRPVNVAE